MYKSSEKFSSAIEKNGGRTFHPKLIFDEFELETEIHSLNYNGGSNGEDNITIGSAVSATLEIKMDKVPHLLTKQNFSFNLGILCEDGSYEFIPMGKFNAEKPETTDYEINVKAYDNMVLAERTYNSQLAYPTTTTAVMKEICDAIGVSFVTEIESITINNPSSEEGASNSAFAGYTMREAIGYIAGLYGKFAIFNRLGQLEFRWYENSDYDVKLSKTYSFTKDEQDYSIDQLIVLQNQETTFKAGSGVNGISCSNPFATQSIVDAIYQKIGGFTFRKGTVKFLGDCRIDPWDIIGVEDLSGKTYKIPTMSISHSVDGGLTTTIESFSNSNSDVSDAFSGPLTKAMERTYAQLLVVNKLIADRVTADYVDANYVKTKELDAVQATIENAVITNLQGKFASIEYLEANYATIESLSATIARVGTLETNSLTANSAVITQLTGGVANINTILFGSASGGSLSTEFSNSVVSMIGNAQIKSAMIESIDASKITALDINTTNVKVHSEDGKSQWKDNTIQISDSNRVRVQIGKDANSDYNMYVWDKAGNLMFDAIGLTEKGINRPVIRNDMVKDDANISASKLDISSLFSVINNDGSHTLKSSKIFVDADNQTLDISFKKITEKTDTAVSDLKNLTSSVETVTNTVNAQGTQITNIQGQINTKIWQQDITTAVTNLQVGGRNLLTKTNQGKTYWSFNKQNGTVSIESYETIGVKINCTVASSGYAVIQYAFEQKQVNLLKPNTEYMLSFDMISSNTVAASVRICKSNAADMLANAVAFHVDAGTKWVHKSVKLTTNALTSDKSSQFIYINGFNKVGTVCFKNLKLEKGNKATDWTPAPEDVDADIASVEKTVTTLSDSYSNLSQTLTEISGEVSKNKTEIEKKADGTTVTNLSNDFSKFKQDSSQFQTTVSQTYATKTEFNNLQIGGTNLMTHSAELAAYIVTGVGGYAGKVVNHTSANHPSGNYTAITCIKAGTGFFISGMLYNTNGKIKQGDKLTLSGYIYCNKDKGVFSPAIEFGTNSLWIARPKLHQTWEYFAVTFTANKTVTTNTSLVAISFYMGFSTGDEVQISSFKLEKGTKPTSWSPAPEDVESSIATVSTTATQTANKFNWLVKSGTSATDFTLTDRVATLLSDKFDITALTTFKTKAQNGTETVINGGAIKANTITADKIKVDSLQAISAKIGGWKINSTSLYTDIVASDGYLRRGYLQTPFKTNPEETWIFSVQKGAAKGETPTTLNGLWYVDGNGNNYMQNLTIAGKILKDVTSDGSVTVNGSQLNAMQNLCIGASSMWTGYSVHCHGNAFIDGKNYVNGDVVCKNMILGLGASTATYMTADTYGSTNFIVNSSIRHVIGQSEDTFYNKSHFAGSQYPHIYGNGTYLILGYGSSQSLQLDNSKRFMPVADNSYTLGYSGYRWKQIYAAAGSISTSDRNAKKDITELDNQSYDFVMGLKPSKYRFIENESNRIHYGLIAQDVEILLWKLGIKTDDFAGFVKSPKIKVDEQTRKETIIDGEYEYGLRYEEFIAPIIKAIQMQDKRIKSLESLVTHLIGVAMNHS